MDQFLANFSINKNINVVVDQNVLKSTADKTCLVGSIDQGTSSTRFLVFTKEGRVAASAQMEHTQIFPTEEHQVGWHEHDAIEIWNNVVACVNAVVMSLKQKAGINLMASLKNAISLKNTTFSRLQTIGVTNQRETTVAWNAETGVPYYHAIVWDDVRTTHIANQLAVDGNVHRFRDKTGLPLASYFAGTKVKWLLDNVPELQRDLADPVQRENVRFGTIDSWLVYQLTGTKAEHEGAANVGGIFVTDVSNASRWLFLDIAKVKWDAELVDTICAPHQVPLATALPQILPSSHVYGTLSADCGIAAFDEVPVAAILGDQQAALFGQCAFSPGEAKNTYGTGLFLMMNTGTEMVPSAHGLLTTIAYQLGASDGDDKMPEVVYALEGSVSHSGSTLQWLRDQLNIIDSFADTERLATSHNDGLYLVPAFGGLFAPHWRSDARACMVGMTAMHHKGHVCRAALEATAYQTKEVFDAIYADSHVKLTSLKVDGGGTANALLMQFQADMICVDVVKPVVQETTAMGACFAAGLAVGVWKDLDEVRALWAVSQTYTPNMSENDRETNWLGWQKAITKSLGWVQDDESDDADDEFYDADEGASKRGSIAGGTDAAYSTKGGFSTGGVVLICAASFAVGWLLSGMKRK
jgi:glycerol kinase